MIVPIVVVCSLFLLSQYYFTSVTVRYILLSTHCSVVSDIFLEVSHIL